MHRAPSCELDRRRRIRGGQQFEVDALVGVVARVDRGRERSGRGPQEPVGHQLDVFHLGRPVTGLGRSRRSSRLRGSRLLGLSRSHSRLRLSRSRGRLLGLSRSLSRLRLSRSRRVLSGLQFLLESGHHLRVYIALRGRGGSLRGLGRSHRVR